MAMASPHDAERPLVRMHPRIFKIVVVMVVVMMTAAWGFGATWSPDAAESYTGLALAMASYLCAVAVGIGYAMNRLARSSPDPARRDDEPSQASFSEWSSREIEVSDGHQRGSHVAMDVLLVPTALAVCMVALVIVWHFAPGS
jgi:hypothetical protein